MCPATFEHPTSTYDGLNRLIGAVESPGSSYRYAYDLVGNRTDVWVDGTRVEHRAYDAANQVVSWSYDAAGNLLNDGTTSETYDARNRLTGQESTSYKYNGDGVLVAATQGGTTTHYAQDLAAPLSQVLQLRQGSTVTTYIYGHARLVGLSGITQTWYGHDALGSLRQILSDTGQPLTALHYDPWGVPQGSATPPTFGFTGELQEPGGLVYLRARWYQPQQGRFLSRDPFPGNYADPVTFHPYVYAAANPSNRVDPSGRCYGYLESLRNISFEAEWCRNLDKAVIIYHHPRATWSQKATAYAYAYTWYAGHAIIIGMAIAGGYAALEAGVGWVMTAGSAWLLTKCSSPPPSGPLPSLPPIAPPIEPVPSPDEVLASFTGRTINHFTDAAGIRGITGVSAETLRVGESVVAEQARFGFGSNIYMASAAGDIFVTDLPMDATSGQLNNIGVFAPKTDYVINYCC